MEHLLNDNDLPDVPLVPLLDLVVAEDMANYALYWVMNSHRYYDEYRQQQSQKYWNPLDIKSSNDFKVTVLGLGRIGQKLVDTVLHAGFAVSAWDYKRKNINQEIQAYSDLCTQCR